MQRQKWEIVMVDTKCTSGGGSDTNAVSAEYEFVNDVMEGYMPFGDGTGPLGLGLGAGRRRRRCFGSIGRIGFRRRNGWMYGLTASVITVVIRDLANPAGFLRNVLTMFLSPKKSKNIQRIRDTEYTVIDSSYPPKKGGEKCISDSVKR